MAYRISVPVPDEVGGYGTEDFREDLPVLTGCVVPECLCLRRERVSDRVIFVRARLVVVRVWGRTHERVWALLVAFAKLRRDETQVL